MQGPSHLRQQNLDDSLHKLNVDIADIDYSVNLQIQKLNGQIFFFTKPWFGVNLNYCQYPLTHQPIHTDYDTNQEGREARSPHESARPSEEGKEGVFTNW